MRIPRCDESTWSPDSKWLTYSKFLENHLHTVFVYSVETGKESQITDGTATRVYPVFDKNGKIALLSPPARTSDFRLGGSIFPASSTRCLRSVYAVVLKKGDPNPVEPQSDEEKSGEERRKRKRSGQSQKRGGQRLPEEGENKEGEKKEKRSYPRSGWNWAADVALPIRRRIMAVAPGNTGKLFL